MSFALGGEVRVATPDGEATGPRCPAGVALAAACAQAKAGPSKTAGGDLLLSPQSEAAERFSEAERDAARPTAPKPAALTHGPEWMRPPSSEADGAWNFAAWSMIIIEMIHLVVYLCSSFGFQLFAEWKPAQ